MNNIYVKHSLRFLLLVLFQVFVLNNVAINGYINPYIYILFILLLPVRSHKGLVLILSFFLGISIDLLDNSLGIHTAASVLAGYLRPTVIRLLTPGEEFDSGDEPGIPLFGFRKFLVYILIITTFHHIALFSLEIFRIDEFLSLIYKIFLSTIFSILLMIIVEYLFYNSKK